MLLTTEDELEEAIDQVAEDDIMVFDLETNGLEYYGRDRLIGVAFMDTAGHSYYAPFRHFDRDAEAENLDEARLQLSEDNLPLSALENFAPLLADPDRLTVGHNIGFDAHMARADDIPIRSRWYDTMLAAHLADENLNKFKLENVVAKKVEGNEAFDELWTELGLDGDEEQDLKKRVRNEAKELFGKKPGKNDWKQYMLVLPPEAVALYAESDVKMTYLLMRYYKDELERQELTGIADAVMEYAKPCNVMEANGIKIDEEYAQRNMEVAQGKIEELEAEARDITDDEGFNPNSPMQVQDFLDVDSSAKDVLRDMDHELAPVILEYRQWRRARDAYFQPYLEDRDRNDRVHTNLWLTGTVTGRLSSSNPNLQALPKHKDNYDVRDVVVAPTGYKLVAADYSQAELRLLAHYTEDPTLLDVYQNDQDLHTQTAEEIGVERDLAKRINFGIVYGITAHGLAEDQEDISVEEAEKILGDYHERIPGVRDLFHQAESLARKQMSLPLWTGRLRHYRNEFETEKAMSNLIQGGVAEIMRYAITRLYRQLKHSNVRMLLQVHDEVLFEIPEEEVDHWLPRIKDIMENFSFEVPMAVDIEVGDSWAGLEEVSFDD